ncbi:hypothetical protein CKAH01_06529 [Colletotrichum kahawae]|uniref:Uncharacterized protein n=1 Tax=Colletotrichum kahawae TaxID=34407 RepID=A0AAD9Y873_COLKA|nr:hypothetical protein CKAH01_06529 [Colletotrichum kahawae]
MCVAYKGDQQQHLAKARFGVHCLEGPFFFPLLHLLTFPFLSNHYRLCLSYVLLFLDSPAFSPGGTIDIFFSLFHEGAEAGRRRRIPKKEFRTADDIPHGRTKNGTRGGVAETLFWMCVYFKLVESLGKQLSLIMTHNIEREGGLAAAGGGGVISVFELLGRFVDRPFLNLYSLGRERDLVSRQNILSGAHNLTALAVPVSLGSPS